MTDFKPLILDSLESMRLGELASAGGRFKANAYKKAMESCKRFDGPILKAEDVKDLDGIGTKIYEKIQEIVQTGALRSAERMKQTTNVGAMDALLKVHGIGPVKAKELLDMGIRSIAELRDAFRKDPKLLNDTQQLGLTYYEAGIQRIPRKEMEAHEARLLSSLPPGLTGTIVGSYRRGAADSGDVDMLVTYAPEFGEKHATKAFGALVEKMTQMNYVVAKLAGGAKKWMGYITLPGEGAIPRRLDLLLTPPSEFAYALLYFTGSDRFNVAFRRHCLDLGYTLNEHTMKPTAKGLAAGVRSVPVMTEEKDIFDFVSLRFVLPTERANSAQIVAKE
jgi:DNA polymerase/3'-5' exonuclease PolX